MQSPERPTCDKIQQGQHRCEDFGSHTIVAEIRHSAYFVIEAESPANAAENIDNLRSAAPGNRKDAGDGNLERGTSCSLPTSKWLLSVPCHGRYASDEGKPAVAGNNARVEAPTCGATDFHKQISLRSPGCWTHVGGAVDKERPPSPGTPDHFHMAIIN